MKVRGSAGARTSSLLAASTAAHLTLFSIMGLLPGTSEVLARREMEFEVMEPPKPEPPPPPPPKEPEPPKVKAAPERAAPKQAPTPEEAPPPDPNPAPAEEVADFTGTTLTATGPGGWSSAVGTGGALRGPVGKIGRGEEKTVQQAAKAAVVGPRVVDVENLSRKPKPPGGLNGLLEQNYPSRARMQGVEGKVVMRMRVMPSGRVAQMQVAEEFPAGFDFADACRKTLAQSVFEPPLDRSGNAVASDIKFICTFVVDY